MHAPGAHDEMQRGGEQDGDQHVDAQHQDIGRGPGHERQQHQENEQRSCGRLERQGRGPDRIVDLGGIAHRGRGGPSSPNGRTISTTAITRNSATSVSLEKLTAKAPKWTRPSPMHSAFTSAMMTAARKAPGIEPIPPTTTTTNASLITIKSSPRLAGSRATCSAPPNPARKAPSTNTMVNSMA